MSFKTLEDRFNEKMANLYGAATTKFEGGRPSNGITDAPLITKNVGKGNWSFADSRSTPINNTIEDVKRLTLFTISPSGIKFLAKQQLLQTGNTFEITRVLNPTFVVANAVPFLHVRRNLRPLSTLFSKTDTTYNNVKKLGQLQQETYNSFFTGDKIGFSGIVNKLLSPVFNTISAITSPQNIGQKLTWDKSRPELGLLPNQYTTHLKLRKATSTFLYGGALYNATFSNIRYGQLFANGEYSTYLDATHNLTKWPVLFSKRPVPAPSISEVTSNHTFRLSSVAQSGKTIFTEYDRNFKFQNGKTIPVVLKDVRQEYGIDLKEKWYAENGGSGNMPFLKYFTGDVESITDGAQFDPNNASTTNARDLAKNRINKSKKISYIKDPSNEKATAQQQTSNRVKRAYKPIRNEFDDSINVSFAMGNDDPIVFRAFIKDLTESATPSYSEYQYIGRNERFINHTGTIRELSFKIGIVAFSKTEVEGVWRRINYLTGLVFPYGYNRGIYQPNIIRLTIGKVFVDQPGYITSLNKNYSGVSPSWDLDYQVPISAEMDIKFTIIEKAARTADSPFHGITEEMNEFSEYAPLYTLEGAPTVTDIPLGAPNDPSLKITPESVRNRFVPPRSLIG